MAEHALLATDVAATIYPTSIPGHGNIKFYATDGRWRYAHPYASATNPTAALPRHITINKAIDANSVNSAFYIADAACRVVLVNEAHSVVGGASAAVSIEHLTGTTAPGSGTVVHATPIDLTATINTVVAPTLSTTKATIELAAGDRLGIKVAGTLTGLVGTITVQLLPL